VKTAGCQSEKLKTAGCQSENCRLSLWRLFFSHTVVNVRNVRNKYSKHCLYNTLWDQLEMSIKTGCQHFKAHFAYIHKDKIYVYTQNSMKNAD
jgi:hypothetical protein